MREQRALEVHERREPLECVPVVGPRTRSRWPRGQQWVTRHAAIPALVLAVCLCLLYRTRVHVLESAMRVGVLEQRVQEPLASRGCQRAQRQIRHSNCAHGTLDTGVYTL